MLEGKRFLNSFTQPISIFDMTAKITNSRVENIIKSVFPQK